MNYDWKELESKMTGQWQAAILNAVAIDASCFNGKHQACPHCGGKDRFRFDDEMEYKGDGGAICSQCGSGNGMAWLRKLTGYTFVEALEYLSVYLNVVPVERKEAIKKVVPKVNHVYSSVAPERVHCILSRAQTEECSAWSVASGIGCDLSVLKGRSGHLVVLPVHMPASVPEKGMAFAGEACNVAFITEAGDVNFLAGVDDSHIHGVQTRGGVTPIGENTGNAIYLVADYADAWRVHYMTKAQVWCCWSAENIEEVCRLFNYDTPRLRAVVNMSFDELCSVENARIDVLVPSKGLTIRNGGICRTLFKPGELLDLW